MQFKAYWVRFPNAYVPLTLSFIDIKYSGGFACDLATFAAVLEGRYIRTKASEKYSD